MDTKKILELTNNSMDIGRINALYTQVQQRLIAVESPGFPDNALNLRLGIVLQVIKDPVDYQRVFNADNHLHRTDEEWVTTDKKSPVCESGQVYMAWTNKDPIYS